MIHLKKYQLHFAERDFFLQDCGNPALNIFASFCRVGSLSQLLPVLPWPQQSDHISSLAPSTSHISPSLWQEAINKWINHTLGISHPGKEQKRGLEEDCLLTCSVWNLHTNPQNSGPQKNSPTMTKTKCRMRASRNVSGTPSQLLSSVSENIPPRMLQGYTVLPNQPTDIQIFQQERNYGHYMCVF